jgi:hypothetical protein
MVGVQDLGEEDPEGDPGGEEAVPEADVLLTDRLSDLVCGEEIGEGEPRCLGELLEVGLNLALESVGVTTRHGGPPVRDGCEPHPMLRAEASPSLQGMGA